MLPDMSARLTLHPLTPQDEADVLAFEREQRAFFRGAVGDRGERFFADDPAVHAALLAEARQGETLPLLVRDAAGALVGRVNFTALCPGAAWLGYRFAQEVQGRGYATAAVAQSLTQPRVVGVREVQARVALNHPAPRQESWRNRGPYNRRTRRRLRNATVNCCLCNGFVSSLTEQT